MSTVYAYAGELFSDNYQFLIPVYQRVYEWEKEEVEVLLNDLESRLDTQQDVSKLEVRPPLPVLQRRARRDQADSSGATGAARRAQRGIASGPASSR